MTIVYKKNDLIKVKITDITFHIKPLTYSERTEIMSCAHMQGGNVIENAAKATFLAMRHAIRDIEGVTNVDGTPYKLSFSEDGALTDDCIDDLLNLHTSDKLGPTLNNFLKGVPAKIVDPFTGEALEGVEIVPSGGMPKK